MDGDEVGHFSTQPTKLTQAQTPSPPPIGGPLEGKCASKKEKPDP